MWLNSSRKNMNRVITCIVILLFAFLQSGSQSISAENTKKRIRFQITTIAEKNNERKTLAQTTIEGLPGTDFNINLQTENFKMETRFLSDLMADDKLRIRANLNTRRFYGYSPINLPLYEEDSQKQNVEISFNEKIVLLPFGRNGSDETLKIEITPSLFADSAEKEPLKITFEKPIAGGNIQIKATKIPHHYEVEAILLADGKEIAGGKAVCLFEEEKEILLQSVSEKENNGGQTFVAKVTVNEFTRNRPNDLVGIKFDFFRKNLSNNDESLSIIDNGEGISLLGQELKYFLNNGSLPKDKNYELRFKVKLAENQK